MICRCFCRSTALNGPPKSREARVFTSIKQRVSPSRAIMSISPVTWAPRLLRPMGTVKFAATSLKPREERYRAARVSPFVPVSLVLGSTTDLFCCKSSFSSKSFRRRSFFGHCSRVFVQNRPFADLILIIPR